MKNSKFSSPILFLLIAIVAQNVVAQKSKIVQSGVVGGVPYASTEFENINLTNGNLNLNFPLASLQGRGQAGHGYFLRYSSKLWSSVTNPVYNSNWPTNPTYQNFLSESVDAGWKDSEYYETNVSDRQSGMDMPNGNPCVLDIQWTLAYRWKVEVNFPDGRKVEFKPSGHSDIPPGGTASDGGYFNVHPSGSVTSVHGPANACYLEGSTPTGAKTVYYSADGSGMRLIFANAESLGYVSEISMPDGSKITNEIGGSQRVTDRNGNYVRSALVTLPDASQAPGWVDQVGRYIARKVGVAPNEDHYYQLGFNGAQLTWKVRWKSIYVLKNYTTTCNSGCGTQRGPVIDAQAMMEFRVVDQIELPSQLGSLVYDFDYHAKDEESSALSPGWGELKSITLPTGAQVSYGYKLSALAPDAEYNEILPGEIFVRADQILDRAGTITKKRLNYTEVYDEISESKTDFWLYAISRTGSSVNGPDGAVTTQNYWDIVTDILKGGQVYKEIKPDGTIIERVWANNLPVGFDFGSGAHLNAFVQKEFITVLDAVGTPALTAIKEFMFDRNGNQTNVAEFDWIPASSPAILRDASGKVTGYSGLTPARTANTSYYNATPDYWIQTASSNAYYLSTAPALRNLAEASEVKNAAGTPVSRSQFVYDNSPTSPITGNLTESRVWDSFKGGSSQAYSNPLTSTNSISTTAIFDQYGNVTKTADARGVETTITYGAVNGFTGLYPTLTEAASNFASLKRTATADYDFHTGVVKTATDVDNNLSVVTEFDALGRPKKVRTAANTPLESWRQTEYNDVARRVIVRSDLETVGDAKKVAIQHYDQLGRVRLSRSIENIATEDPYNEQHGIKVQTRYKYDYGANSAFNGTYTLTSNPFRAATSSAATSEPTMGWAVGFENKFDTLTTTETFSGASLPAPWGSNSNSTGLAKQENELNTSTTTDEAGKKRRTITDGLGRLVRVDEPDANGDLGSVTSPYQPTDYSYDALGNLLQIQQIGSDTQQCGTTTSSCAQTRSFGYSSLSRLIQATNPESGTFQYTYDPNGNLKIKTDGRGITTTHTYDELNRVKLRDYSDATPDINYTYDDAQVPFSKGKLIKVFSDVSETSYLAYDEQGRIKSSRQRTDGNNYDFAYTYNLDGDPLTQTYPSLKVVRFAYDANGDLEKVAKQTGSTEHVYANSFTYSPHGQVEKLRLGNGKWETTQFNSSRQIGQIGLGHSATDTSLWKANYEYGEWNGTAVDPLKNSGNVGRQTILVPTIGAATGFTAVQTYTYDKLDRLKSAVETVGGSEKWKQTFGYDRFGNRNFETANSTIISTESSVPKIANPEILPNSNKYKQDQDGDNQPDYLYDTSGNITKDARQRDFTFDAENRQITATGSSLSMTYSYDGNGKRVKSHNSITNQTTIFVYDADGDLAAEYTINVPAPVTPVISYTTEDALGSPRVITNSFGEIKSRRDFLPFGEELYAGLGNRNTNQKYSSNTDDTRQKFTGYQRDAETGLDFAQSRYYAPMQGRFTSPDEFKGGPDELFDFEEDASSNPTFYADLTNPQSLNKYQYTYNNPYKYTDPSGHCPPIIIGAIAVACYILLNPTPIGPRQPQSTVEAIGDVLGILPIPGVKYAGGFLGKILLKGPAKTAVTTTAKQTTKQVARQTTKQVTTKTTKLTANQAQKGIRKLQRNIAEHKQKLADYKKNPLAGDNKDILKNASPANRQKIIDGRIKRLEGEIRKFENEIKKLQ